MVCFDFYFMNCQVVNLYLYSAFLFACFCVCRQDNGLAATLPILNISIQGMFRMNLKTQVK